MVDFEFYVNQYVGNRVPQRQFPAMAARAAEYLARFERICRVEQAGEVSRKMAICAIAETLATWERQQNYQEEAIGSVRVRYQKNSLPLQRQLLQNASGYMEIYRGLQS